MSNPIPSGVPDLRGTVTQVRMEGDRLSFSLETGRVPGATDRYVIRLTPNARIAAERGGGVRSATPDRITAGVRVNVWLAGPVLESEPAQANARAVLVRASAAP